MLSGMDDVRSNLLRWFSGAKSVVLVGVGNPLRRDDGIGIEVIHMLKGKVSEYVSLIDSETVPEDFIEPILEFKPTHILIIDAAVMEAESGSVKLYERWAEADVPISTHMLPIQVFCGYLFEATKAKIAMLLIQPENTEFGEGLTPALERTAKTLVRLLLEVPVIGKS